MAEEKSNGTMDERVNKKCAFADCPLEAVPISNYCKKHEPHAGGGAGGSGRHVLYYPAN